MKSTKTNWKMTQIDASLGSFSLRKSLQNDPQNLIFGACGAKNAKNAFLRVWKNYQKSLFLTVE